MISHLRKFHFYRAIAMAALLLTGLIAPSLAQSLKEWKCTGNPDFPPDQQITGCTNAIQSGKYSGKDLSRIYFNRGNAYIEKGDYDRAIADYNEMIRLDPKNARVYTNRGAAYLIKGNLDSGIADLNEAIKRDPKDAFAYINRGSAYFIIGDFDRAVADYSEAIRLDGKNAYVYKARGIIYRYGNSLGQARADFQQANALAPKDAYAALWLDIAERRSNLPSHLVEAAKHLDMNAWPAPVVRLFLGETTPAAVLSAADDADPIKKKEQVCEANFFGAEHALLQNKKDEALRLYQLAASECPSNFIEARAAKAGLALMAK